MGRRSTRAMAPAILVLAATLPAAPARADGLPIDTRATPNEVAAPGGALRYTAHAAPRHTAVLSVRSGGEVARSTSLPGEFAIPTIAIDGTAGGLSADGRTLVLVRPRKAFPRKRTSFAILDARGLRLRELLRLRGDFSFDALSPDGSALYLIQYVSPRDPARYVVRAYDLAAGRLDPEPVVDRREPGELMRGFPLTRATGPGGRWEYTLYDGAGNHPFVHALDTKQGRAFCIDLPGPGQRLRLGADGRRLTVLGRGGQRVATIDTETLKATAPRPRARAGEDAGADLAPVAALAAALAGLIGAGWLASMRRQRAARSRELDDAMPDDPFADEPAPPPPDRVPVG
jgi:hypothetical protein